MPKGSKWFQTIPKDSKELISKECFAIKEPARAQKANGSSLCKESMTLIHLHWIGAYYKI